MASNLNNFLKSFSIENEEKEINSNELDGKNSIFLQDEIKPETEKSMISNLNYNNKEKEEISNKSNNNIKEANNKIDNKVFKIKLNKPVKIESPKVEEPLENVKTEEIKQTENNNNNNEIKNKIVEDNIGKQEIKEQESKKVVIIDPLDNSLIEKLFIRSETLPLQKEKWVELYKKAHSSDKKTMTNDKIKRGRFRLDENGVIEILPDFDTYAKSSKDLLETNWFKK